MAVRRIDRVRPAQSHAAALPISRPSTARPSGQVCQPFRHRARRLILWTFGPYSIIIWPYLSGLKRTQRYSPQAPAAYPIFPSPKGVSVSRLRDCESACYTTTRTPNAKRLGFRRYHIGTDRYPVVLSEIGRIQVRNGGDIMKFLVTLETDEDGWLWPSVRRFPAASVRVALAKRRSRISAKRSWHRSKRAAPSGFQVKFRLLKLKFREPHEPTPSLLWG